MIHRIPSSNRLVLKTLSMAHSLLYPRRNPLVGRRAPDCATMWLAEGFFPLASPRQCGTGTLFGAIAAR